MQELQLLSNGFFSKVANKKDDITKYKNYIGIDYYEDFDFTDEGIFNVMVDDYTFNINDLKHLETINGINFLQEHFITDEEYEQMAVNYYIEYNIVDDKLKVIISIYDFDNTDKKFIEFIEKFGREIQIIINTEEERNIIFDMLSAYCYYKGYNGLEDFIDKEYTNYEE